MKKIIYFLAAVCSVLACKKETGTNTTTPILKSVTYTHATTASLNKVYTIYRNASDLIDSVVVTGATASDYKRFVFFQASGKLDSVLQYNSSNAVTIRSIANWSGNNLVGFWVLSYVYDSNNRIIKKLYPSGSFFRVEHFADSSVFYYDEIGADPEYKSYVQYFNKSLKNPFRLYKYENAFAINNLVFNAFSADSHGMYSYPFGDYREYNPAGTVTMIGTNSFSGNLNGYPTSMQFISNGSASYTLTFAYE